MRFKACLPACLPTCLAAAALICLMAGPLLGQAITDVTNDQSRPIPGAGHDYTHLLSETVDPANGTVSLRISVPVPPGRKLTIPFSFDYNSNIYVAGSSDGLGNEDAAQTPISSGGWSYSVPTLSNVQRSNQVTGGYTCTIADGYVFQAPNGSSHALYLAEVDLSSEGGMSCDGDEFKGLGGDDRYSAALPGCRSGELNCQVQVAAADGTVFTFAGGPSYSGFGSEDMTISVASNIEDTNGNYLTITGSDTTPGQFQVTDTAGRTVISSSGFGSTGNTVTVGGLTYTITWGTINAGFALGDSGNFSNGSCAGFSNASTFGAQPVITAITPPNGQAYSFSYDPTYGYLSKVVYPGGGFVEYTWGVDPLSEAAEFTDSNGEVNGCLYHHGQGRLTERQVSFDGSTIALQQNYAYTTTWDSSSPELWDQKTTTVTTQDFVSGLTYSTKYTYLPMRLGENSIVSGSGGFSAQAPVENETQYLDGGGIVVKTVYETWADPDLMTGRQTVWPDGATDEQDFGYDSAVLPELTEEDDYDYGSGGKGALLRCRAIAYAAFAATPIYPAAPSIADRPASVTTYNGSCSTGAQMAQTTYAYDQSAPSGTTGIVGKDYSSGNVGNLTSESRWANTSGSWLTTTFAYDDLGNMILETDPRGEQTQFGYTDSWSGAGPSGATDAYLTSVTDPLGHSEHWSYFYASGELASATDQNNQTTSYAYNDSLDRLTQADFPDSGETTYTYNDAAPSPSVTTSREITSGNWLTTVAVEDGMGHVVENETTSDPAGADYVATTYDGEGQALSVTNPYRSTSDPTYGVTSYAYDALGRVLTVTNPDGSTITTSYAGAATQVTDGGNGSGSVSRVSQVDGLGRLISVCEVDSSAMAVGGGAAPAACGQDIAATGFLTTYGYDALGNLTSVAQSGLNGRQFSYDSLSRLLTAANPESGTVSYTYDAAACGAAAAPGLLTCRTDARGITTAYSYDADSRLSTKTYSDGTPSVQLIYDQSSPWNQAAGDSVGRLTTAQTLVNGVITTGEIFGYGPMGRVLMNDQCTPQNCNQGHDVLTYGYDLLGDMTSASNGAGVTLNYGYNNAAELTTLTSSLEDSQHPGTLFSSGVYNAPADLVSATLGNGDTETGAYNDRLRLTARNITGAAGIDPAPGTGTVAVSGAEQSVEVPSTHSTGSITIEGSEGAHEVIKCPGAPAGGPIPQIGCTYTWYYNSGTVSLTVNGVSASAGYGEGSTDNSVASALNSAVNSDGSIPVTATVSGATVTLTSKGIGTGVNYSLATACTYNYSPYFNSCSFYGSLSGAAMTGGSDITDYDSGTVSADINGQTESAAYGQGSTDSSVASALATAITNGSSYATATAPGGGATLDITARSGGASTDYSLSASSATSDPSQFSSPSFTGTASGPYLTGGVNGEGSGAYNLTGISYAPDGDVLSANDSVNGQWTYEYGPLNRLLEACSPSCTSPATALQYVYDRFGNRWEENVLAGGGPSAQLTFDANNHIVGASYDASGDLLGQGSNTFTYDAEGRIASASSGGTQYAQYIYDAFGHRVEKITPAGTFYYLHDLSGRPITELASGGGFNRGEVYLGGRHLATYSNSTTYFDYADWLGTERMRATVTGYAQDICTSLPYGADLNCAGGTDYSPMHFTGQVRDAETGLDHFPARYYTSTWGRWLTPDWSAVPTAIPYAKLGDPESLDLYAYALGNPATRTDRLGHSTLVFDGATDTMTLYSKSGARIGSWPAYDNVDSRAPLGKLPNGTYPFLDTSAPRRHPRDPEADTPGGAFGPSGIFRLKKFLGPDGRPHTGVGVHGGRAGVSDALGRTGPQHATRGCLRTCNEAMHVITKTAKTDPLTTLTVEHNRKSSSPRIRKHWGDFNSGQNPGSPVSRLAAPHLLETAFQPGEKAPAAEHVLCGINVYSTTLPQVIALFGNPTSFKETTEKGYPPGSGERTYVWAGRGIRMTIGTEFRTDKATHSVIESSVMDVDVRGAAPVGLMGVTGAGLKLGDTYADVTRTYGHAEVGAPGRVAVNFEDGTFLAIDLSERGRITHMNLFTNPD